MEQIKEELVTLFSKIWVWVLYILLGVMMQFSYDYISGRKLSFGQRLASTFLALAVGGLMSIICVKFGYERAGIIAVPASTLLSRDIVSALMTFDWKKPLRKAFADVLQNWADNLKK